MSTTMALGQQRWPRELWNQLSSIDLRLIDELAYLCRRQAQTGRSGAAYCHPGRRYLARKLGCSIPTVSRHISKLKALGMLTAFQRRPKHGTWQTNLYKLIAWTSWRAAQIRHLVASVAHRVSKPTHIAASSEANSQPQTSKESLRDVFDRWRAKGLLKSTP